MIGIKFLRLLPAVFIGVFTLAACGSPTPGATSAGPAGGERPQNPAASASAAESSVSQDQPAGGHGVNLDVDFKVEVYTGEADLGGQEIQFSNIFDSGKPVVLNYWAGLCPPCRAEMPDFQEFHVQYGDRVTIFGLDIGPFIRLGSIEDGKALLEELGITYPTGTTLDPELIRKHPPLGMPTTLFMTPDGTIVRRWTGLLTKDKLAELADELFEASAS